MNELNPRLWHNAELMLGISSASQSLDGWRTSTKRRTYGYTHTVCPRTATTQSKWKLVLRTAYTLNLSIISRSVLIHVYVSLVFLDVDLERQIPSKGCHSRQDLLPTCSHKDQTYGALYHPKRNNRVTTKSI